MTANSDPLRISIPQQKLDWILSSVQSYPWDTMTSFDNSWKYGPPPSDLRSICEHWISSYNWRNSEAKINQFSHYKAHIQNLDIHYIHEPGSGSNPQPLLLLHGWPYSFISYIDLIEKLAHPERFGGNAEDGFTVIVPSLPGFGFSSKPTSLIAPTEIADIMNELVTKVLRYEKYISHGGDWGSYFSELLAFTHPEYCVGIHVTMSSVRHHGGAPRSGEYVPDATEVEKQFALREKRLWEGEKAYNLLQSTRPLKLAYAMHDSPVGTLAYILEAFHAWSDLRHGKLTEVFTMNQMLDEVMVYLVADTFNTSTWIYAADHERGAWTLPEGKKIEVPVGVLASPDPVFPMPPREVLERSRRLVQWREVDRGGHFLFYENGGVVVEELLAFGRLVRGG